MKKISCLLLALLMLLACGTCLAEGLSPLIMTDHLENVLADEYPYRLQLTIDPEGEQVALFTEGTLDNILIEKGTMDPEGVHFIPEYTLFFGTTLEPNMLLVINTYFSDTVPTLRVRYSFDGNNYSHYLFQSGEDGSILLLPAA